MHACLMARSNRKNYLNCEEGYLYLSIVKVKHHVTFIILYVLLQMSAQQTVYGAWVPTTVCLKYNIYEIQTYL